MNRWIVNARFLTQPITGVQRFAIEISKQLKKANPAIIFVAPNRILHHDLARDLDVQIFGELSGHLWEQIELPFYLRQQQSPLLINLANTAPISYNNYVATIHDLSFLQFPQSYSRKFYYYYKFLIPKVAHKAKVIITVSENAKLNISKILQVNPAKIHVVPNAVSSDIEIPKQSASTYGRYILSVASINPIKNINGLIEAFNMINLPNLNLVIAGASNASFPKQKINTEQKNIIFTGHISSIEKLFSLYANAEAFVLSSFYESFGIPNLEAMKCRCPVITSDVGALREVCGEAALYINPYDTSSIAAAIKEVLTNTTLRQMLITKGTERVKNFAWPVSAQKLIKIAEGVV
jgi:glycosyltransferase involved in cell wall biosynthesis